MYVNSSVNDEDFYKNLSKISEEKNNEVCAAHLIKFCKLI
jgi:hypothetical protein